MKAHYNITATVERINKALEKQSCPHDTGKILKRVHVPSVGALTLLKLNSEKRTLESMDRLYMHGFGNDFPVPIEFHRKIVDRGVVIGACDQNDELVGMWGIFIDYRDGHPVDPAELPEHANAAYLSHSVVHKNYRSKGVGTAIAEICRDLVKRELIPGIRASVSPWNYPSLGLLFKTGFSIVDFRKNLYGHRKHRFHVFLSKTFQNTSHNNKNAVLRELQEQTIIDSDSHILWYNRDYAAILLNSEKHCPLSALENIINNREYHGIMLLNANEMDGYGHIPCTDDVFLLCRKQDKQNKT